MSSGTSRSSGYRLEDQAQGGDRPVSAALGPHRQSNPSWVKVIGTTFRLWLRRRVLHVADSERIGGRYRGRIVAVLAVIVVVAGGAVAGALTLRAPAAGEHARHASARPKLTPAQVAARAAATAAARANDDAAAHWIAGEVGSGEVIGCDPATCAAILAAGYPTGGQVVLQPGVPLPGPGSIIVATGAIRAQYGARLSTEAPEVIASFGTGAQAVQVAVVVPGGAAAYDQTASQALAARRHAGQLLLRDRTVHARGVVKSDLRSGLVDPRLITVLRLLARRYGVYLLRFGGSGPQAGQAMPFRMAEVAVPPVRAGRGAGSDLRGMVELLQGQPAGYRARLIRRWLAGRERVLKIEFPAPSPV